MKVTLAEALEMIVRGETNEQYEKRIKKLRRYCNERYDLEDAIEVLEGDPMYKEKLEKKKARLKKVLKYIDELQ